MVILVSVVLLFFSYYLARLASWHFKHCYDWPAMLAAVESVVLGLLGMLLLTGVL